MISSERHRKRMYLLLPIVTKGIPRTVWSSFRNVRILLVVVVLFSFLLMFLLSNTKYNVGIILAPISIGGISYYIRACMQKFSIELLNKKLFCCLDCGYDLNGLPDRHICPECGTNYDRDDTQEVWKNFIQTYATKK